MKKISIIIFMLLIQISLFPQTAQLGDVNEDGLINIIDALLIVQYFVGLYVNDFNPDLADVNCDNKIDVVDALLVAQCYVGIIPGFSCIGTPVPTFTPTPTTTPIETLDPNTGRVFVYPETQTVYGGEHFTTGIRVHSDFWFYCYLQFVIYYDDNVLNLNEEIGVSGFE